MLAWAWQDSEGDVLTDGVRETRNSPFRGHVMMRSDPASGAYPQLSGVKISDTFRLLFSLHIPPIRIGASHGPRTLPQIP